MSITNTPLDLIVMGCSSNLQAEGICKGHMSKIGSLSGPKKSHAHANTNKVIMCMTTDKGDNSPFALRVKPPLTALAADFQLLCLSSALLLRLALVIELDTSVGLFLLFLVFIRLVSSPNCVLISMSFSLMDELCLASLRGAVDTVPDCSVISVGSDPAGDKN